MGRLLRGELGGVLLDVARLGDFGDGFGVEVELRIVACATLSESA
jgi:hypothetical protein